MGTLFFVIFFLNICPGVTTIIVSDRIKLVYPMNSSDSILRLIGWAVEEKKPLTAMWASISWSNLWGTFQFYPAAVEHLPMRWLRIQYRPAGQRYWVLIHFDQKLATSWSVESHQSWFGEQVLRFEYLPKSTT